MPTSIFTRYVSGVKKGYVLVAYIGDLSMLPAELDDYTLECVPVEDLEVSKNICDPGRYTMECQRAAAILVAERKKWRLGPMSLVSYGYYAHDVVQQKEA